MTPSSRVTTPAELQIPRFPVRLVALRTGLTPHVLRAWERRYRVVTPTRSEGGQRLYSQLDIERLSRLRRLTERGHAIGRIAGLGLEELIRLEAESGPARPGPAAERPAGEGAVDYAAAALGATRRFDAPELQAVLERAALTLGVPDFLDGVVARVLKEIGQSWNERSLSIAQEHMATAVFRRVLGWLLGVYAAGTGAPRLVVATPPGQVHELGALMVAVTAAAEGWAVTYLGPDLPAADLVSTVRETGAQALAVSVVYVPEGGEVAAAIRETRLALPSEVPLLLGGAAAAGVRLDPTFPGIVVIDSLAELRALLGRLGSGRSR